MSKFISFFCLFVAFIVAGVTFGAKYFYGYKEFFVNEAKPLTESKMSENLITSDSINSDETTTTINEDVTKKESAEDEVKSTTIETDNLSLENKEEANIENSSLENNEKTNTEKLPLENNENANLVYDDTVLDEYIYTEDDIKKSE